MPTIAEQWIQKGIQIGIRQGLLETVEFGLKLKFGKEGLKIYPQVTRIDDIERLRSVKSVIEIAADTNDIKDMLK